MITELSSIAFALAGMNPAPLLTPVIALQDGRMEKFVAAPRGIKIPVGEEIVLPVPAVSPTREGSTTVVQGVIIQMDHAPVDQIERRVSIRINGLQAVQVIDALQAQQVNMMIDMNRFPMSSNLFIRPRCPAGIHGHEGPRRGAGRSIPQPHRSLGLVRHAGHGHYFFAIDDE
jgi:hypothetical protein